MVRSAGLIAVLVVVLALYPAVSAAAALSVTESRDQNPVTVSDDQNSGHEAGDQNPVTPPNVPSMSPDVFNTGGLQYPYTYYYYYYPSSYCYTYYYQYYG